MTSPDLDFHPTDVLEDADGSLVVVDTGGWYKLCCPSSQLQKPDVLGGVYRVRRQGAPRVEDPRGLKLSWKTMMALDLVNLLDDPRPAVQHRAIESLGGERRRRSCAPDPGGHAGSLRERAQERRLDGHAHRSSGGTGRDRRGPPRSG